MPDKKSIKANQDQSQPPLIVLAETEPEVSLEITIPERIAFQCKRAGNPILQFSKLKATIKAIYKGKEDNAFILMDQLGRKLLIYPPRANTEHPENAYKLRALSKLHTPKDLKPTTKLKWISHPVDNLPSAAHISWKNAFRFVRDSEDSGVGLREPQIGAIHAIAAHWTAKNTTAMVVMPTGTGKTETMMSVMIHCQCPTILVIVPSDALRTQLFKKFSTLGCLRQIGVVPENIQYPRVVLLRKGLKNAADAEAVTQDANIIIATAPILAKCNKDALDKLTSHCTHLFVDEAHHLAAKTWTTIKQLFESRNVVLFTATPFRRDGKRIDGEIIYNYPLERAQKQGYFRPIDLLTINEFDDTKADRAIAIKAVERLRKDLTDGRDHMMLARVKSISSAAGILAIYQEIASDLSPILVHSGVSSAERARRLKQLSERKSRIVVCVDMFGEGFDLPELKVAAIHEIHKSLPVTLQFIGRFTRSAAKVGDAAVVINIADTSVDSELQGLYTQDADWNTLLRRSSEGRIAREISLQELIKSFQGNLPKHVPLWNLRPSLSMMVYETSKEAWTPGGFATSIPKSDKSWHAVNDAKKIAVAVVAREEDVDWGKYRDIKNLTWNLIIAYWDEPQQLFYLHADDYKSINPDDIAHAFFGEAVKPVVGQHLFNIYRNIERPLVKNLGASKVGSGNIRFTMFFGHDVTEGLSQVEKSESAASNIFAWGYEAGDEVTLGCAVRKGKIWSRGGGPIDKWCDWCHSIGIKLKEPADGYDQIVNGFLRSTELKSRHPQVPVGIEWGEGIIHSYSYISIRSEKQDYSPHEIGIRIQEFSDSGPIQFVISADGKDSAYELLHSPMAKDGAPYEYKHISGPRISIVRGSGEEKTLEEWTDKDPLLVLYADGSFSSNQFLINATCPGKFSGASLTTLDWTNTNIRKESQGPERASDSIQFKAIHNLIDSFDIVFNDDGAGEVADIIAMKTESEDRIRLRFVHCKFSSENAPGSRVNDMYELCGQAQKCVRWKHLGIKTITAHMSAREEKWQKTGQSRFIKGDLRSLKLLEKRSRRMRVKLDVEIIQPGLSKQHVTDPVLHLLGSTELYLHKTAEAKLSVICND